jgi:hypothetical protein
VPYPGEPDVTQDRPTSLAPHDASDDDFAFVCSLLLPHTGWGRTFGPDGQVASVRLWDLERYALNRHDLMDGGPRELTRPCCGCCRSGRRADGRGEPLMASPNNPHPGAGAYSNAAEIAAQLQGRAAAVLPSAVSVVRHCAMLLETQIKANASGRPGPNAPTGDYRRSWTHEVHTGADAVLAIVGTSKP